MDKREGLFHAFLTFVLFLALSLLTFMEGGCNTPNDELAPLYGPPDSGEPVPAYGSQLCADDQDCQDWYGQDWYCSSSNMCYEAGRLYGPPDAGRYDIPGYECTTDQQCQSSHGPGWYCNSFNTCSLENPPPPYGVPDCFSDEECLSMYGQGWYCDQNNWCALADLPDAGRLYGPLDAGLPQEDRPVYGPVDAHTECDDDQGCQDW